MLWTLPRDALQNSRHVAVPLQAPPSEEKILEAIKAQYRSIYKRDFTGMYRGRTCFAALVIFYLNVLQKMNSENEIVCFCFFILF